MDLVCNTPSEKKVPTTLWPKAVNWVLHVLYRSPTLADKTPKEA